MTISIDLEEKQVLKNEKEKKHLFKKKEKDPDRIKTPKKIKWGKTTIVAISVIILSVLAFGAYKILKISGDIGLKLKAQDIISKEEDHVLEKDSTGKHTNFLIVGIDSRDAESKLLNTDSIIFVSFDYETKDITLISVPRDFYVSLPDEFWFKKINSFYSYGEGLEEGSGLEMLQTKVEELVGEEIQYYAMLDLKGFVELIDALGGVYINVENSFTDYSYPADDDLNYQTVSFTAGPQTMDGETALKYSRSRHSLDNGEGSDFARARRQQKVIEAVKKELFDSGNYTNPQILLDLLNTVGENLTISEFTIDDIKAVLNIFNNLDEGEGEMFSFVLDPNAANGKIITSKNVTTTNAYAIGPVLGLGQYEDIHDYVNKVLANPSFYEEDASIYVYDTGLGYQNTYNEFLDLYEKYPYSNIRFMGSLFYDKEGTIIYEHETGLKSATLLEVSKYLKAENTVKPEYITSNLNGEDITILFGKTVSEEAVETDE